ncbi:hypothetical protein [Halosolutus halophilus]|uniref:hypothetical protein n=1 Tax=Halosolutus halophilus TaxID=1552990 RepID=UPI0022352620|nr:hypothetical protein [Halosolutus halophilus]
MQDDYGDTTEHDPDAKHDKRGDGQAVTHRDRIEYEPNPDRRGRWLSAIVGLLGLWLVGTAVALDPSAAVWNDVLVGAASDDADTRFVDTIRRILPAQRTSFGFR